MPSLPKDTLAVLFVHLVTVVCCGAAGWFVLTQGSNLPVMDEWDVLAEWVSADSTAEWAVRHHSEHRYPLGKLVWLGVLRGSGYNFKAPMYVTVGLLTAAAVLFQWTARGQRGYAHPIDAAFPVLLLHLGHGFNLIMGYQVGFALVAYGVAGWVWCGGRLASGGGGGWAGLGCGYAVLIAPCGGFGLAFTPAVVAWVGFLCWQAMRSGANLRAGGFALIGIGLCGYAAWVLATLPRFVTPGVEPFTDPVVFLAATVGYLSTGLGTWPPALGPVAAVAIGVVVGVGYAAGLSIAGRWVVRNDGRRVLGVAVVLIILGSIAVGLAAARARGVGVQDRFVTPSAAGLCAILLAVTSRLPTGWRNLAMTFATLLLCVGVVWANLEPGLRHGYYVRSSHWELNGDLEAGQPPTFLMGRHGGSLGVLVGDRGVSHIDSFRRAGIPPFHRVPVDPALDAVPVPGIDVPFTLTCQPEQLEPGGAPPVVRLPSPPPGAIALRCRTVVVRSVGWQRLDLHWTDSTTGAAGKTHATPAWQPGSITLIFPLSGRPTDLRLVPGSMLGEVVITSADWLLPAGGGRQ